MSNQAKLKHSDKMQPATSSAVIGKSVLTLPGPRCGNGPHSFPQRRLAVGVGKKGKNKNEKCVFPQAGELEKQPGRMKKRQLCKSPKSRMLATAHAPRFKRQRAAAWPRLFRKRVAPGSPAPTGAGENQALLPVAAEGEASF